MTPEINNIDELKAACRKALTAFRKAALAREQFMRFGHSQDEEAYIGAVQNEAQCYVKYLDSAKQLRDASMRQQR
jgi:hypothetical protein